MARQAQVITDPAAVLQAEAARAARVFADTRERLAADFGIRPVPWSRMPGAERALLTEICLQMILIGGWSDGHR